MNDPIDLYVGCYTLKLSEELDGKGPGIVLANYDPQARSLTARLVAKQRNPTYLTMHPTLSVLYAVEELALSDEPRVFAYQIEADGGLTLLNSQPVHGAFSCHLAVIQNHLLVANYGSGNVDTYPLGAKGRLEEPLPITQHIGSGPNPQRQEGPHAHMVMAFNDELIYVADLGIDRCKAYQLAESGLLERPALDLRLPAGSGPRHLVRHPQLPIAYVLTELSGEVIAFQVGETTDQIQEVRFFPEGTSGIPSGASIRIDAEGRFLWVSERTSSTLTQFAIGDDGSLRHYHTYQLEDRTPRDFDLIGPWLIVAGQDSNTLSFWEQGKDDVWECRSTHRDVMTPSCVVGR
ncbi:MAG: lactonase family protein [Bacteroidota bacterium]